MKNSIKTEINTKKALNYDLDSKKVKKYYKGKNNAWSDVKKFLKENGFYNRQYSGVVSQNKMSPSIAIKYVKLLNKRFPWLKNAFKNLI